MPVPGSATASSAQTSQSCRFSNTRLPLSSNALRIFLNVPLELRSGLVARQAKAGRTPSAPARQRAPPYAPPSKAGYASTERFMYWWREDRCLMGTALAPRDMPGQEGPGQARSSTPSAIDYVVGVIRRCGSVGRTRRGDQAAAWARPAAKNNRRHGRSTWQASASMREPHQRALVTFDAQQVLRTSASAFWRASCDNAAASSASLSISRVGKHNVRACPSTPMRSIRRHRALLRTQSLPAAH